LLIPVAGASGLAIDGSTPAAVSTNASVASLTTASFTPPLNSLLVVIFGTGWSATGISSPSNTGGGVTWNGAVAVSETANNSGAAVWLGTVTTSASMTVTCNPASAIGQWGFGVAVVTGQAASPAGATNVSTSGNGIPTCTIASLTGSNSLVLAGIGNATNGTIGTPGTGQSITWNGHSFGYNSGGGGSGWGQYLTGMNLAAGSSATISDTAPTIHYSEAMLEILAATGAAAVTPQLLMMGVGS